METEREEVLLRVDETFAMIEHHTDDEGISASGPEGAFVPESFRNFRAPLPYGW